MSTSKQPSDNKKNKPRKQKLAPKELESHVQQLESALAKVRSYYPEYLREDAELQLPIALVKDQEIGPITFDLAGKCIFLNIEGIEKPQNSDQEQMNPRMIMGALASFAFWKQSPVRIQDGDVIWEQHMGLTRNLVRGKDYWGFVNGAFHVGTLALMTLEITGEDGFESLQQATGNPKTDAKLHASSQFCLDIARILYEAFGALTLRAYFLGEERLLEDAVNSFGEYPNQFAELSLQADRLAQPNATEASHRRFLLKLRNRLKLKKESA